MVDDGALNFISCRLCVTIAQVTLAVGLRGECIIAQSTLVRTVSVVGSKGEREEEEGKELKIAQFTLIFQVTIVSLKPKEVLSPLLTSCDG